MLWGCRVRVASSSDNAGTGRHRQTVRVRQARREGVTRSVNQCQNPLKRGTGSNLTDVGRAAVRVHPLRVWVATPKPTIGVGGEAHRERLRRCGGRGCRGKAGRLPRRTEHSEHGNRPDVALSPHGRCGDGQAHRRLMVSGRDGASVVVRGRESRPHGEGRQRVSSSGSGMPGGRQ